MSKAYQLSSESDSSSSDESTTRSYASVAKTPVSLCMVLAYTLHTFVLTVCVVLVVLLLCVCVRVVRDVVLCVW